MEKIHILLSADNKYAPWCGLTIRSIFKTTTHPVEIHIGSHQISPENKKKLLALSSKKVQISIFEINEDDFKDCPVTERLPLGAYIRLFASKMLPDISKILYLDCDILVRHDLWELWCTDLSGYPMAAIPDINYLEMLPHFGFKDGFCINSGVLLMNLDFIRSHKILDLFLKTIQTKKHLITCADQCVINMALHNKILELPKKYNSHKYRDKNDVIVHFIWDKPWSEVNHFNKYQIQYLKLLIETPWKELWPKYKKLIFITKFLFFYQRIKTQKTKKYKIFGITLIKKRMKKDKIWVYFLNIPVCIYKRKARH